MAVHWYCVMKCITNVQPHLWSLRLYWQRCTTDCSDATRHTVKAGTSVHMYMYIQYKVQILPHLLRNQLLCNLLLCTPNNRTINLGSESKTAQWFSQVRSKRWQITHHQCLTGSCDTRQHSTTCKDPRSKIGAWCRKSHLTNSFEGVWSMSNSYTGHDHLVVLDPTRQWHPRAQRGIYWYW